MKGATRVHAWRATTAKLLLTMAPGTWKRLARGFQCVKDRLEPQTWLPESGVFLTNSINSQKGEINMAVPGQRRWLGQQVGSLRGQVRLVFPRTSTLEYLGEKKSGLMPRWKGQSEGTSLARRSSKRCRMEHQAQSHLLRPQPAPWHRALATGSA